MRGRLIMLYTESGAQHAHTIISDIHTQSSMCAVQAPPCIVCTEQFKHKHHLNVMQTKRRWNELTASDAAAVSISEHDLLFILCGAKNAYALHGSIYQMRFRFNRIYTVPQTDFFWHYWFDPKKKPKSE